MPAPTSIDTDELRRLHAQGLVDHEIADRMGIPKRTIARQRQRLDLAHNYGHTRNRGRQPMILDETELRRLHADGLNNTQIADRMGVSQPTIRKQLRRLGLTSNYHQPGDEHPAQPPQPRPARRPKQRPAVADKPTDPAKLRAWRINLLESINLRVITRQLEATQ